MMSAVHCHSIQQRNATKKLTRRLQQIGGCGDLNQPVVDVDAIKHGQQTFAIMANIQGMETGLKSNLYGFPFPSFSNWVSSCGYSSNDCNDRNEFKLIPNDDVFLIENEYSNKCLTRICGDWFQQDWLMLKPCHLNSEAQQFSIEHVDDGEGFNIFYGTDKVLKIHHSCLTGQDYPILGDVGQGSPPTSLEFLITPVTASEQDVITIFGAGNPNITNLGDLIQMLGYPDGITVAEMNEFGSKLQAALPFFDAFDMLDGTRNGTTLGDIVVPIWGDLVPPSLMIMLYNQMFGALDLPRFKDNVEQVLGASTPSDSSIEAAFGVLDEDFKIWFESMDASGDDALQQEEITAYASALSGPLDVFESFDVNDDDYISFNEIVGAIFGDLDMDGACEQGDYLDGTAEPLNIDTIVGNIRAIHLNICKNL